MRFAISAVNAFALLGSVALLKVCPTEGTFYPCKPKTPCPGCPGNTVKELYFVMAETDNPHEKPFTFSGNFLNFNVDDADYCFNRTQDLTDNELIQPGEFNPSNPFDGGIFSDDLEFHGGDYNYADNYYWPDDVLARIKLDSNASKVCQFKQDGHFHLEENAHGYQWCKDNNNAGSGCVQKVVFDQDHNPVLNVQLAIECCMGCGNGIVEPGEECDDESDENCNDDCTWKVTSVCGNGHVEEGEECDDGNHIDDDGDPHIQRWGQKHDSFHGECDMVFLSSSGFHDGTGLDIHVRSTIEDYFSYFETAAFRIGDVTFELYREEFFVNGVQLGLDALPFAFGKNSRYHLEKEEIPDQKNSKYHMYYNLSWDDGKSNILFKFYKGYLTISINAYGVDFADCVGLLGQFPTGAMISRDGKEISRFMEYGFEWQVDPTDPMLFVKNRAPQLPFEQCRMPTASRPAIRKLRAGERKLQEQALSACATADSVELCVSDVMTTGDLGLASLW
eukprot:scaffold5317_cov160-Amphora_coffeaeformis.AAC.16